jgi:ATP-dependent Clp protease adaptor protein ClpS
MSGEYIRKYINILTESEVLDKDPKVKIEPKIEKPKMYKVVLWNDDYTPAELVVQILKAVFRIDQNRAFTIMMTCHRKGSCAIMSASKDVAETKVQEAIDMAKKEDYALKLTAEPEE